MLTQVLDGVVIQQRARQRGYRQTRKPATKRRYLYNNTLKNVDPC